MAGLLATIVGGTVFAAETLGAVTFFTNEAAWLAAVQGVEQLTTNPAGVDTANEVAGPPAQNDSLPGLLTFNAANTGLSRSFTVQTLETNALFTFSDGEASPVFPGFLNALSVGDIDNFENDDWRVTLTGGPAAFAFGFSLGDNGDSSGSATDQFTVYDELGVVMGSLTGTPSSVDSFAFLGFVSDQPFRSVSYDDDAGGDDIAIADFRFAVVPEPATAALLGFSALIALRSRRQR